MLETEGRWLIRTGHLDSLGEVTIDDSRITIKRGIGSASEEQFITLRVNKDNRGFGRRIRRSLGLAGDRFNTIFFGPLGSATDWQFELEASEQCEIELGKLEILASPMQN